MPNRPKNPVNELPLEFSGKRTADKLADIRKEMLDAGAEYLVVSELDEIACKSKWSSNNIYTYLLCYGITIN